MIYLGMSPWEGMWKNRHHLMSRFAQKMPVLYVEPWLWMRTLRGALLSRDRRQALNWSTWSQISTNLYVFKSPAYLPVSTRAFLGPVTQHRWYSQIRRVAHELGMRRPILWLSRPEMAGAIGRFDECLSIYHIVDEYGGYTGHNEQTRGKLWATEQGVLDNVDISIVVSRELLARKAGSGREIFLMENAVDIEPYDAIRKKPWVPADLESIPSPRLGYSGLIGKRLELTLLYELAKARQDWSIVLLGKVDQRECAAEIADLSNLSNVYFLGEKPHEVVPDYVSNLDIGLLPYRINLETRNISPLKMYEYLAAGLPVVSTGIPAALVHKDLVDIRDCVNGFIHACDNQLASQNVLGVEERIAFARQNTWESRVEHLWEILCSKLEVEARD
jgi:glycosyltransferase involved in cell wall biosynthesis